ncbi:NUDIX hydrolase [Kitasatospora hibisci]|uniref:NUDIX hydrolase n=1 Tax=Kitasatospora hibisci TaxID=3369522 RepID=UPI003753FB89
MCDPLPPPTRSEVLDVRELVLVEAPPLRLSAEERTARDRAWEQAVRRNPTFFDGPVVACTGTSWDGPGRLVVRWTRTTYRHYALRSVPGTTVPTGSLSVSVLQPTPDRRLLVGRMSPATATPGRWQPPGGSVEPRPDGRPLGTADLQREAARELVEETGVRAAPEELKLWAVTHRPYGSIGVLFLAPALPRALLCERFAALPPERELVEIAFVGSPAEVARLAGPRAEYLDAALHRYASR